MEGEFHPLPAPPERHTMTGIIRKFPDAKRLSRLHATQARAAEAGVPLSGLSAGDDQYRAIFDLVQDGIFITDPATGRFIEVNTAGCAMYGYTRAELIGQDIALLSSGVYPYTLDVAIETSNNAAPGETKMLEWRGRKKDGSLFWAEGHQALYEDRRSARQYLDGAGHF